MAKLSDILVLDRTSLTRILKPMLQDETIVLVPSQTDARVRIIALTALGRRKFAEAVVLWESAQAAFESRVGREAWMPIGAGLRQLVQILTH
jgi:DNA-binding MarR family transcriptional regulator